MRKTTLQLAAVLLCSFGSMHAQGLSNATGFRSAEVRPQFSKIWSDGSAAVKKESAPSAEDLLGCPEGTVFGGEFKNESGSWTGFASSDMGRTDVSTSFYQHFTDCYYKFNAVRFLGMFNYWDSEKYNWIYCNERGALDEKSEMTKPVRFRVAFYEEDANGMPGREVYAKEFDILGENTGVYLGDETSGYGFIYSFKAELGETINMEHGYMQVSAVDTKDKSVTCFFSLFTTSTSEGYGLVEMDYRDGDGPSYYSQMSCCYCFYGDGSYNSKKALKLERMLSPKSTDDGKYAKVQTELYNISPNDISDTKLELWCDGNLVGTEEPGTVIKAFDSYKYTFTSRADISAAGEHKIVVKNVTPGDEHMASDTLVLETKKYAAGNYPESYAEYAGIHIQNVKIGSINNNNETEDGYLNFSGLKTTITPGDTLTLNVTSSYSYGENGAWIDWNGNGMFDDAGEALTFGNDNTAKVAIPDGVRVPLGDHRLRIVASTYDPQPTGSYSYGQTHDYTITVNRAPGAPWTEESEKYIELTADTALTKHTISIANTAEGELKAGITYNYILPNAPTAAYSASNAPASEAKAIKLRRAPAAAGAKAPQTEEGTQYVLKYDNGKYDIIGLTNYDGATYATCYPGTMLKSIEGMKISSVDVYVGEVATTNSIVIYGEKDQNHSGDLITEKTFTPEANSWNHVTLDTPVSIADKDIWVGYKTSGAMGKYSIGIDHGTATIGFGDLVNIGGEYWWSMADLGLDYNYCIRANVTGNRTPAISWLSADCDSISAKAGTSGKAELTINVADLPANALYEANIEIETNDKLNSHITIPVYVLRGEATAIIGKEITRGATIRLSQSAVDIAAEKTIKSVTVSDLSGSTLSTANVGGKEYTVRLDGARSTICIVSISYADGTHATLKVPVIR